MSARRSITLSTEEIGPATTREGTDVLVTEVRYNEGGPNYFSGGHNRRGYEVACFYHTRTPDGFTVGLMFNSGIKKFLEPAARFSAKRLSQLIPNQDDIAALKARVLEMRDANAPQHPAQA